MQCLSIDLNTSNVNVNQEVNYIEEVYREDLNTSNVNVNRKYIFLMVNILLNLNTSNVNVNLLTETI